VSTKLADIDISNEEPLKKKQYKGWLALDELEGRVEDLPDIFASLALSYGLKAEIVLAVDNCYECGGHTKLEVYTYRDETDTEIRRRVRNRLVQKEREEKTKERKKQKDIKELQRLKKKYE